MRLMPREVTLGPRAIMLGAWGWLVALWLHVGGLDAVLAQPPEACLVRDGILLDCEPVRRWGYALSAEVQGVHVEGRPHQGVPHVCVYPSWPRAAGSYCAPHRVSVEGVEVACVAP